MLEYRITTIDFSKQRVVVELQFEPRLAQSPCGGLSAGLVAGELHHSQL